MASYDPHDDTAATSVLPAGEERAPDTAVTSELPAGEERAPDTTAHNQLPTSEERAPDTLCDAGPPAGQVLSVSDAVESLLPQLVAGRLLAADAAGADVRLADAFAARTLRWATVEASALAPGTLVVVRARLQGGAFIDAELLERRDHPAPSGDSDWRRLAGAGARRLQQRAAIIRSLRAFFDDHHYLEVDTPVAVPSPGLDQHLDGIALAGGEKDPQRFLSTSPEYQMKRLLSAGFPRIFQLARCFRRGEIGRRHNPEFTMLEWYTAFATVEQLMTQTEQLVRQVICAHHRNGGRGVAGHCDVTQPFERISVESAFARFAAVDSEQVLELARQDEERFFRLLIDKVEPALAQLGVPVFLYDYPASQASLARLRPNRPAVAERFELYLGDWELCNGFGELTDAGKQRARLLADQGARKRAGKPVYPIDERFVAALQEGMPPAAGNALGVDRLVALCLDCSDIDEVMTFSDRRL